MKLKPLLITAMCLVIWRLLLQTTVIAVPGVYLYRLIAADQPPSLIGPNSLPFERLSVGDMGIGPYIAALVIISLVRCVSRRMVTMSLERWAVAIGVMLSFAGAFGWTSLMQSVGTMPNAMDPALRTVVCLELAGGTAVMIFLAHTLDEHGLGFGYGPFLLFALGPFADQIYRLYYSVAILRVEGLYAPLVIWTSLFLGVAIVGIALLLAVRRVEQAPMGKKTSHSKPAELRLMTPGVLRPPQFAFAILSLPALLAPYYVANTPIWMLADSLSPYGPDRAVSVAFMIVELGLVVFFAWFVAAYDWSLMPASRHLRGHVLRLGLLSGAAIAVLVVIVPIVNHALTERTGGVPMPLSGADTLLLVAVVLLTLRSLEGHPPVAPLTASPVGIP